LKFLNIIYHRIYKNEQVNVNDVFFFKYTNEILHCEVNEQVYQDILTEIKRKCALIILIVDLLDIPNSINRS
jgi:hypothetical protein